MNNENKTVKSKYAKAKTPEMVKKQRAAIINYYINKRKDNRKNGK